MRSSQKRISVYFSTTTSTAVEMEGRRITAVIAQDIRSNGLGVLRCRGWAFYR